MLCEEVRQEANGNFFLIGVITVIRVPQVPITAFKLFLFNQWTAGVGVFTENVRLIAPDQTTVLRSSEFRFELKDPSLNTVNITVFRQVEFKAAGVYYVEVIIDDVMKLRYPLLLAVVAPPAAPSTEKTETSR